MWYTVIWLIVWLLKGDTTFSFGNGGVFWSLIVALVFDLVWNGYYNRTWLRRP